MTNPRPSNHAITGALCAAILAGCSAGSQFAPPVGTGALSPDASHQGAVQPLAPMHASQSGRGVSPDWVMWTGCTLHNGKLTWYFINRYGEWLWLKTGKAPDNGSTLGGSATASQQFDLATTAGTIEVYRKNKLEATLTGLGAVASGVATDSRGDTFAAVNLGSEAAVEEFASGATSPTATYADPNLESLSSLAVDKAGHVYVEGQSINGGIEVDEMIGSGNFRSLAAPGTLGATAGGLRMQSHGKTDYAWINDLGNASVPANIARYEFDGKTLVKQGSFGYSGSNGAIAVDPSGKNTTNVYAVNNVAQGSQYSVTVVEYDFPSGNVVSQSPALGASQPSSGLWVR
jgi:hypothetical protein